MLLHTYLLTARHSEVRTIAFLFFNPFQPHMVVLQNFDRFTGTAHLAEGDVPDTFIQQTTAAITPTKCVYYGPPPVYFPQDGVLTIIPELGTWTLHELHDRKYMQGQMIEAVCELQPAQRASDSAPAVNETAASECVDMVFPLLPDKMRQGMVNRILAAHTVRPAPPLVKHTTDSSARMQHNGRGDDSYSPEWGYDRPAEYGPRHDDDDDDGYGRPGYSNDGPSSATRDSLRQQLKNQHAADHTGAPLEQDIRVGSEVWGYYDGRPEDTGRLNDALSGEQPPGMC